MPALVSEETSLPHAAPFIEAANRRSTRSGPAASVSQFGWSVASPTTKLASLVAETSLEDIPVRVDLISRGL